MFKNKHHIQDTLQLMLFAFNLMQMCGKHISFPLGVNSNFSKKKKKVLKMGKMD